MFVCLLRNNGVKSVLVRILIPQETDSRICSMLPVC